MGTTAGGEGVSVVMCGGAVGNAHNTITERKYNSMLR